ncbi:MAG: hypothetical protein E7629_00400 [Ruminococcaceae bacterium]|nr:hypothetical protein [Oscillospiraceae bacterium]
MNTLKRLLIAILAISMLCAPLAACKKQDVPAVTEEPATSGTGEGEALAEPVVLCDADKSYYKIVRPATAPECVGNAAAALMDYPLSNGARNLKLSWSSDKNAATDAEILIGYTNRPESLEVLKSIDYDDFAIVYKNGKIVIAAHTAERMEEASEYLLKNLLQIRTNESGKKELVYLGDYVFKGEKKYLFNLANENQLSDYAIVYQKDSQTLKKAAEELRDILKNTYGVELPVADDSAAERECELLIGNVNRAIAKEYIENATEKSMFTYVTAVKDQKILIGAQSDMITDYMIDSFCNKYIKPDYTYLLNIPADTLEVNNAISFSDSTELAEGANMRVMSFNILCELWNNQAVIEGREIPVIAPIYTYQPDILGLQEVSDAWYDALDPLLGETYAVVDRVTSLGDVNFSPLLYNTETMTLLDHGVKVLPYASNNAEIRGLRVLSWGYFERKSDGARFVAINTHWNVGSEASDNTERLTQAKDMVAFIETVKSIYNCPIVTTGDYNNRTGQEPYDYYVSETGFKDAGLNAKVVNRLIKTTHTLFASSVTSGAAIDHVFTSEEFEILYYNTLCDKILAGASDHYPVYADLKLTKQ